MNKYYYFLFGMQYDRVRGEGQRTFERKLEVARQQFAREQEWSEQQYGRLLDL